MRICLVDKAGSGETLKRSAANISPVFAISGLGTHDALILGRVWVKAFDTESDERALYTASIQNMCRHLQSHLEEERHRCSGDGGPKNACFATTLATLGWPKAVTFQ